VRIWGNYIDRTTTGIATTVTHVGPVYIFRNVYNRSRQLAAVPLDFDERNVFAKAGTTGKWGGGRRYVFHNTLLQGSTAGVQYGLGAGAAIGRPGSHQPVTNTVSRNNIFQVWKPKSSAFYQIGSGNDFGYDLYNANLGAPDANSIQGTPKYADGNGPSSEAGGLYQLAPGSPGYDAGVRIPNFNDGYVGRAPDIGAHEAGTPPMRFGLKAAVPNAGTTTAHAR